MWRCGALCRCVGVINRECPLSIPVLCPVRTRLLFLHPATICVCICVCRQDLGKLLSCLLSQFLKLFLMEARRISVRDQRRPLHSVVRAHHPSCDPLMYLMYLCWSCSGESSPRPAAEERRGWSVWGSLTGAKGEKVRLVGIPLQQSRHAASHSLVALVDEFLAEVVVYLLGRDAVVSRQGAVDELRQLKKTKKKKEEKSDCKSFKIHIRNKNTGKNADLVKTWWMSSSTLNPALGCLFIYLFHLFSGSEKLWTGGGHGVELLGLRSGGCSACLWATERPNVFTFLRAWGCKCLSNCCVIY